MLCQGLKAQHGVKLDIATVTDYGPQLLTAGLVAKADGELESQFDKSIRED